MVEPGTYRSGDETYDQWAARKKSEADADAAKARDATTEQRIASVERRFKARLEEITQAVELAFGDLRGEVDERLGEQQRDFSDFLRDARVMLRRLRSETSERRTQIAAVQRDYEKLALEVEKLRQELAERPGLRSVK
ncbi:hypothetical protein [Sinorhizobium fredii]|uniref:hypothetical protein n=1 Tax=Rhizobium fredii TaxID=380 RepID=UPI0035121FB8